MAIFDFVNIYTTIKKYSFLLRNIKYLPKKIKGFLIII